jgi:hypothetical protein
MVLDAIYGVSWAWSSMNPVMLVPFWRKLLPDVKEDDLQGFPSEEISKSKILDMVCAMRSFENINEEMLMNGYSVMRVNWPSSTRQIDIVNATRKQKGEEEGGEDQNEIHTAVSKHFTKTSDHYKPFLRITSVV